MLQPNLRFMTEPVGVAKVEDLMDFMQAIYSRRAVREFTAESVDEKTLGQLIDAAIQAPSAVNEQPWLFSVVLNMELLSRISHEAKTHMVKTTPAGLLSHSRHFQEILNDPTSLS
jgi:nitroreductase